MTTHAPQIPVFDEDPYAPEHLADPHPLFARMREAGPAVWLPRYDVHAFTRFDVCREILADHPTFISGAGVGPVDLRREKAWRTQGILETDQPAHTVMRDAMANVISPRSVRSLRTAFEAFAEELADRVVARGRFDAVTDVAEVFPLRVFGDAVGIPREGRHENLLAHGAMNFSAFGPDNALHRAHFAAGQGTHEWVMRNCARESLSGDGLGARIWEHAEAGRVSEEQATLLVRAMLSAGLDTTVIAIGNVLRALANTPEQWALLREDPANIRFAVDESFRHESPFQSFYRTAARDACPGGVPVPAGAKVLLFVGAANRDPRQWGPDADAFRVTRAASGHLAFGMGIHQCVGQPVSRLEMEVLLGALVRRIERLEPAGPDVPFVHNTLRGWSSVPVRAVAG
ncbi:cytochrome P450 [Streptomyces antnestii]|uniref:Cytochrome P450 n=1 Tax=Streptomyces antnestii TaxID=2494256 RepID=A0A3S2Z3K9_9ACTN|nr:cytochrome P450 [Streptomyces sp. San01]RVU27848.1 cytochrome P450 [Streptomyces sp. San01]